MTSQSTKTIQLRIVEDYTDLKIIELPSLTRPGVVHYLKVHGDGRIDCTCEGWTFKKECRHVKGLKVMMGEERLPRTDKIVAEGKPFDIENLLAYWETAKAETLHALYIEALRWLHTHEFINGDALDSIHIHGSRRITAAVFRRLEAFGVIMKERVVNSKNPDKHYQKFWLYRRLLTEKQIFDLLLTLEQRIPE